jgi:hypothetical protein
VSIHGILEAVRSELSPATRCVWVCLENHANGHRFWAMTAEMIAAELHLGLNTAHRAITELEAAKIIRREKHNRNQTVFHMLRTYPDGGSHTYQDPENGSTTQNGESVSTHQNGEPKADLTTQNGDSSPNLTTQNGESVLPPVRKTPPVRVHQTPRARKALAVSAPDGFEAFWRAYPRRVGKGHALKAYTRALREGASPDAILAAVSAQRFPMDPQFIKHPATWLNAKCWLDEISETADERLLRKVGLLPSGNAIEQLPLLALGNT